MEERMLRPKPMPGHAGEYGAGRRPHPARPRGRRLWTALLGVLVAVMLVLAGVGLGTVGATVIGMSRLSELKQADLQLPGSAGPLGGKGGDGASSSGRPSGQEQQGGQGTQVGGAGASGRSGTATGSPRATLGVEAVDLPTRAGALLVGVHVPGPGYTAGLVRGDVILAVGGERTSSAAELASAVAKARPGAALTLTVRHRAGERESIAVTPGVVT
ncbi:PDZ domain-containing protein [Streptomyces sp. Da 82-17]|uniref:PDZ domain-containing protein n=1 Tax=Streptomyces sp. Da 82-17 TaxID=3377116 RepID=UPI0038D3599E